MWRTLLIDLDAVHAERLRQNLLRIRLQVDLCHSVEEAATLLRRQVYDVLVLVSSSSENWSRAAELLLRAADRTENASLKVCFMRSAYRGPADRLYGKQLGWRVLYECR